MDERVIARYKRLGVKKRCSVTFPLEADGGSMESRMALASLRGARPLFDRGRAGHGRRRHVPLLPGYDFIKPIEKKTKGRIGVILCGRRHNPCTQLSIVEATAGPIRSCMPTRLSP